MTDIVLETQSLTKYYGNQLALDHLDVQIPRGCVCGFIGRNGAGKTTAIKLFLGLLNPTSGSSSLFGCDSQDLTPSIRQRIGYVTEGHRLFHWMSINDHEKFQRSFFPGQWDDKFFADMIEYFGLPRKKSIKHFSIGQRAQVSLALALAPHPELLIMDDPMLGLDAAIRRQFLEGMIELIMRQGRTVFFSSHILSDVERIADRISVIDKGVLKANCSVEQFRASVKKVRVAFEASVPSEVNLDGLLNIRQSEKELELILVGTDDDKIAEWVKSSGAEKYQMVNMNLEDQFIEYTAPPVVDRLFKWQEM